MRILPALFLAAVLATRAAAQDGALLRYRTVSPPDCVDVSSLAVQYDAAPTNRTYMRVQHMGDPDTLELQHQVSNPIAWDVGEFTGLSVPRESQRGYVDRPGYSAFQLHCADAGFFINTATFSHGQPLVGQGPNVSIARDFDPPLPAFARGESLSMEARVRVPWIRTEAPPENEGTAQVGFFLYFRDRTSGTVVTQLVGLFDDRRAGLNGSGVEGLGHDGVNAFVSSPLAAIDAQGRSVRFVKAGPSSARWQDVEGWTESRHFAAVVTPMNFAAALAELRASGLAISVDPADYNLLSFGIGGEVIAGTDGRNDVQLGVSASNLALRVMPALLFRRP